MVLPAAQAAAAEAHWQFAQSEAAAWLSYGPGGDAPPEAAFFCSPGVGSVGFLAAVPAGTAGIHPGEPVQLALTAGGVRQNYDAGALQPPGETDLSVQAFLSSADPIFAAAAQGGSLEITVAQGQPKQIPLAGADVRALVAVCEGNPG